MKHILLAACSALALAPLLTAAEKPYEMVWANRTSDDRPGRHSETHEVEARTCRRTRICWWRKIFSLPG